MAWATARLEASAAVFGHGCDNSRDEAIWAVLHVAGLMHQDYDEVADRPLAAPHLTAVRRLIERRIDTRRPLAYLLREAWFAGYSFYIDERAIVPRSHIGDLIQDGLEPWVSIDAAHRVLDLCCGGGGIAVALALTFPHLKVDAADIDPDALEVARLNIDRHRVRDRVDTIHSDLFKHLPRRSYDLIVANPPYVASAELDHLPAEYQHEPRRAFAGGEDGLSHVNAILRQAGTFLSATGHLLIELGGSAETLAKAHPQVPFLWLTTRRGESVVALLSRAELECYRFDTHG